MPDSPSTSELQRLAIEAALRNDWAQALELNLEIIKQEPKSIECLNRLAKASLELGKLKDAQKYYKEVLELDPYNSIAQKNLKKISLFKGDSTTLNHHLNNLSASLFVSEPGLTKSITLIKVAEPQKLLTLSPGMLVNLTPKNRGITVTDSENKYLGALPDDIAFHLLRLIKGGNKYQAFIQSVRQNGLTILVKEVFRSKRFKNQVSFLDEAKAISYSSEHITLLTDEEETPTAELIEGEESNA